MQKTYLRRLIFSAALAIGLMPAFADAGQIDFTVHLKDGTAVVFPMQEKPLITPDDELLVVKTTKAVVEYNVSQVEKMTMSGDIDTGIEPTAVASEAHPVVTQGYIAVTGLTPGEPIALYALNGTAVARANADDTGVARANIEVIPAGVYIISYKNSSFKFIKK